MIYFYYNTSDIIKLLKNIQINLYNVKLKGRYMKILKSIYENEVEVKEISVLKSLFIIIMFTLIPGIINFLLTFIMILIIKIFYMYF